MGEDDSGVLVDLVFPNSSAEPYLQAGDILLQIEGQPIANDGSVLLPPFSGLAPSGGAPDALRVDLAVLVDRHQIGDVLQLKILRQGERKDIDVPLLGWDPSYRYANQHDTRPRYFVYAGLVFVPLDLEMMKTFGPEWRNMADKLLLHEFLQRPYQEPEQWGRERVVLLRRLDHPLNSSMTSHQNVAVERVNGKTIQGLQELVDAIETHAERFHLLEFSDGRFSVIDRELALSFNQEILERYGVTKDRNL